MLKASSKTLLIATLFLATAMAQGSMMATNLLLDIGQMPTLVQAPLVSACGQHQVVASTNVCIKPEYIEGCETYETARSCDKCASGYNLNKDKRCVYLSSFTGIVSHIKGCISQSSGTCNVCAQGFYQKQNKCALGIRNCVAYNSEGECQECETHYSLILSQCRKNGLLGCKYEGQSHTCKECYPPFKLNGQHCEIDQCRILNDYGCVACECGYYLTMDRECKPIAQGCLRYEKGVCKNCLPHYKLKGGICEIEGCVEYSGSYCKKCSEKYQLVDGECKFKNCVDWLNDQCITCNTGFGLKGGVCVAATAVVCA